MPHRLPFRSVTSRQNPIVTAFRDAAASPADELVLIEGARLAREAVCAGWTITAAAFSDEAASSAAGTALLAALPDDTDRIVVSRPVMAAVSPAATPSGVVALARRPRTAGTGPRGVPLMLIAEGVQDPGNVGAMARAAEAAGASEFIVAGASADPFGWKALRGSMGSAFRLPIVVCGSVADAMGRARTRGARVVALTVRQGKTVYDADLRGPIALVVGGEGPGLPADAVAAADDAVSIPMAPPVESLNVAVAAGVALYEAARQRRLALPEP